MFDVSQSPSKKQIRTSKISVFIVSAGQLKNSQHWQGYQRADALKRPIHNEMNEHKNHVGCLKVLQKSRSGPRKYPFL